ncbi:MAG: LacI family transcriptional regulator [Tissierellia bacterium]|nr:LacI family transcriptional regulator [Tissierellia bacterium]
MKITINDIAKMANVSKATVSRVINNKEEGVSEETRKKILKIIDEVGYVPNSNARSITVSETKTIGLVIPDVRNLFFAELARGVEDCSSEHGYTVFLCNSDMDNYKQKIYLNALLEKRVDGIILDTSGDFKDKKFKNKFYKIDIPVILIDRKAKDLEKYKGVFIDNVEAGYKATKYLLSGGYENVAYIGGTYGIDTTMKRFEGYKKAIEEAGIELNPSYVVYGDYSIKSGHENTLSLIKKHREIKGIFAGSDIIAIGVIQALKEMNILVPDEIEVVGIDNISVSQLITPSLTTVAQPIYKIGYRACKKLINYINHKFDDGDEYLSTELIVRDSTRKRI